MLSFKCSWGDGASLVLYLLCPQLSFYMHSSVLNWSNKNKPAHESLNVYLIALESSMISDIAIFFHAKLLFVSNGYLRCGNPLNLMWFIFFFINIIEINEISRHRSHWIPELNSNTYSIVSASRWGGIEMIIFEMLTGFHPL